METLERKYHARLTAKTIADDPAFCGNVYAQIQKHARQMVVDGRGEFKFAKAYGRDAGDYANATLWVIDNTTCTMRDQNLASE